MTDSQRTLCFVVSALYEVAICDRFRGALLRKGWRLVVVTHVFSAWLDARRRGIPATLSDRSANGGCPEIDAERAVERRLGLVSRSEARRFQHSLWAALNSCLRAHRPSAILQWNGQGLSGGVATRFAHEHKLATLYFELGNIEPKLFADRWGVNAAAEVAAHPEILDRYQIDQDEIETWKARLITRRSQDRPLQQATGLLKLNPWFIADLGYKLLTHAPQTRRFSITERLREKRRLRSAKRPLAIMPDGAYLFFPMQVSRDSNLLVFSSIDNFQALEAAERLAAGKQLVVKPHPAETQTEVLDKIAALCAEKGWLLTSFNTTRLIQGAEGVITINSTVGLEAKLMGKPLTVLGESLYGLMSSRQVAALVMRRLVDFNIFEDAPATDAAAGQLLDLLWGADDLAA